MKKVKRLFSLVMLNMLSLPYLLMAQDEGTYIEDLGTQDSSYMQQDMLAGSEQASGTNNAAIIIVVAVVVIVVIAFLVFRKKKKAGSVKQD